MTRRRQYAAAGLARLDAMLRAHERRETSDLELKVLNAVASFTSSVGLFEDRVEVDRLAALVYALHPDTVKQWHRNQVNAAGKRLRDAGVLIYRTRQGRPRKDDGSGGSTVLVGFPQHEEIHPVASGVFGDRFVRKVTPSPDEKALGNSLARSEKVISPTRETHHEPGGESAHAYHSPITSLSRGDREIAHKLQTLGRSPEAITHAMNELARRRDQVHDATAWAIKASGNFDERQEQKAEERRRSEDRQAAIDRCELCDHNGFVRDTDPAERCLHPVLEDVG